MTVSFCKHQCTALFVVLLVLPLALSDLFDAIDANNDGMIDRQEYSDGITKLTAALNGPLPLTSSHKWELPQISDKFWRAFTSGVAMIIATEIGDKTFFIAAVLSMKYSRSAVFGGAIVALIVMTVLSTCMGLVLPNVLPKEYTHILGGILFLYFGVKLIMESRTMEANRVSEELEEVEEELLHPHDKRKKDADEEQGEAISAQKGPKTLNWYQVFLQSLSLSFLAEWGDRSQIATIALAAAKNPYGVTVGACIGHCICSGIAVMGGRMLAARISEKTVAFWGGCIFLVFGIHSIFFEA